MTDATRRQPFRLMLDCKIPMRDSVNLSAGIWLPADGERFPVLLLRTPYNNKDPRHLEWTKRFVEAGYAVVMQDCRGRHDSDGVWDPYVCEVDDGYDTHEWIGQQPWCDGSIGMFGISYPGFTQTVSAHLRSRYLKALVPIGSQQDNYGVQRLDGVVQIGVAMNFANHMGRVSQRGPIMYLDQDAFHRRLPLVSALDDIVDCPFYRDAIEHETYDEFWTSYSLRDRYPEVEAPAYFMTGWYDGLLHETLKVFNGWQTKARSDEVRRLTKLLIGPWGHQAAPWGRREDWLGPAGEFCDVAFGSDASFDIVDEHLRWYDARLKGADNGMDDEPQIRLFVMGENRWRHEHEWPLARTEWTDFYLHSGGSANTLDGDGVLSTEKPGDEPADRFSYDPDDPVPTWGGQYLTMDLAGPRDHREVERRADVLVYTSAPLERDLEVTGPVTATVYAASSAPDTDFTAGLMDVHPDGRAIVLCEGIRRARFRDSLTEPTTIEPGRAYEYRIDMWDTSNLFRKGHRIRVEISSSNFPRFDRNQNTGRPGGMDAEMRTADQTVLHDAGHMSRVTLPVIPRG